MRTLGLGTLVIAILAVSALLDRESGLEIWLEWRENLSSSSAHVERLVRENEALRREIELLEAEPEAIDRAIREELDLALPGEVVVRFSSEDTIGRATRDLPSPTPAGSQDRKTRSR